MSPAKTLAVFDEIRKWGGEFPISELPLGDGANESIRPQTQDRISNRYSLRPPSQGMGSSFGSMSAVSSQ